MDAMPFETAAIRNLPFKEGAHTQHFCCTMPSCDYCPPAEGGARCGKSATTTHKGAAGIEYYFCRSCNRGYNRLRSGGLSSFHGHTTAEEVVAECKKPAAAEPE